MLTYYVYDAVHIMRSWGGVESDGGGRDSGLRVKDTENFFQNQVCCVSIQSSLSKRDGRQKGEDLNMCDYVPLLCYRLLITVISNSIKGDSMRRVPVVQC